MSHINPPPEDRYYALESRPGEPRLWRDTYTGEDLNAFDMMVRLSGKPLATLMREVLNAYCAAHKLPPATDEQVQKAVADYRAGIGRRRTGTGLPHGDSNADVQSR